MEELQEELVCPQCKKNFDDAGNQPHMLPECGHSICKECIFHFIIEDKSGQVYQCPEDQIAYENIRELQQCPKNIMLIKMIEKVKRSKAS